MFKYCIFVLYLFLYLGECGHVQRWHACEARRTTLKGCISPSSIRDGTQAVRRCRNYVCLLSHLTSPTSISNFKFKCFVHNIFFIIFFSLRQIFLDSIPPYPPKFYSFSLSKENKDQSKLKQNNKAKVSK